MQCTDTSCDLWQPTHKYYYCKWLEFLAEEDWKYCKCIYRYEHTQIAKRVLPTSKRANFTMDKTGKNTYIVTVQRYHRFRRQVWQFIVLNLTHLHFGMTRVSRKSSNKDEKLTSGTFCLPFDFTILTPTSKSSTMIVHNSTERNDPKRSKGDNSHNPMHIDSSNGTLPVWYWTNITLNNWLMFQTLKINL